MLPKKRRLTTHLFDLVFKGGKMTHSERFWIRSFLLPDHVCSRFAVATSKKVAKTAVDRNTIKRMIYRTIKDTVPAEHAGFGVIVGVKNNVSNLSVSEIESELSILLNKALK